MVTVSFSENKDFQKQVDEYLAEMREKLSPEDQAKIDVAKSQLDACADIIDKQTIPEPEIIPGILNSEFRIINDIVEQNARKVENTVNIQAERLGIHSAQQFQYHGSGICAFIMKKHEETCESIVSSHAFFQNQITDQIKELNEEIKQLKTSLHHIIPMDLSRGKPPSPDQDSNGCLDGNKKTDDQAKVLKKVKEAAEQDNAKASSTLQNKANHGDMNKQQKKKHAPNAEQIPGSPESAIIKNRGINGVEYIKQNEFWADTQMIKSKIPKLVKDPNTGKERTEYETYEYEAKEDYNYRPTKSAKKRMRKRRLDDAARAKCEVVIHGLEESIDKEDIELLWLNEAKTFIKFTEELSPNYLEKDGVEITLDDIDVINRILVWGDGNGNGPLPMVVKLKD